jgi:endoglucanase
LQEALSVIRKTNSNRTVIIGPGNWNSISSLDKLVLPQDDRHIIVTVHYYSPMEFTHQGAAWAGQKDKSNVTWEGTAEQKAAVAGDFDKAQRWSREHKRPIFLGEFGVHDKAPMESRARYLGYVTGAMEERNWSWAYWQFDSDFILYDIDNESWNIPVRDALIRD